MEYVPPQHECANHPGVPATASCAQCGRPCCQNCAVEFMGQQFCYWCRNARLYQVQARPQTSVDPRPVVMWARIYNGVMIFLSIVYAVGISVYMAFVGAMMKSMPAASSGGVPPPAFMFNWMTSMGVGFGVAAVVIALVAFIPPLFGPSPGRGWYWSWQMVAIIVGTAGSLLSLGVCGIVTMVPAIILLIFWVKPEVRAYCDAVTNGQDV